MNWRKRKKLWKQLMLWGTPSGRKNGSNKSIHTFRRINGPRELVSEIPSPG